MMGAHMRLLWYLKQEFKVMGDDVVSSPVTFWCFAGLTAWSLLTALNFSWSCRPSAGLLLPLPPQERNSHSITPRLNSLLGEDSLLCPSYIPASLSSSLTPIAPLSKSSFPASHLPPMAPNLTSTAHTCERAQTCRILLTMPRLPWATPQRNCPG
jgi:hypothetical protein